MQARKEAQTVIGDSKTIGQEKVDKLEYISAVINESLRMYPPASIFIREVVTEDQLGDYKLAKGSFIIIPICSLHHSEENWKNHNQFIPERFLGITYNSVTYYCSLLKYDNDLNFPQMMQANFISFFLIRNKCTSAASHFLIKVKLVQNATLQEKREQIRRMTPFMLAFSYCCSVG